jgi:hypothetical protein
MNDVDPHEGDCEPREGQVDVLHLGDALGQDTQLADALDAMATTINEDSPRTGGYRTIELLKSFASWATGTAYPGVRGAVSKGIKLFTQIMPALIRERGEADLKRIKGEAEAKATVVTAMAEAAKTRAEADWVKAAAAEERAKTKRKDAVLDALMNRGIDFSAGIENNVLNVVFTKDDDHRQWSPTLLSDAPSDNAD